jgi:hypothetical protein
MALEKDVVITQDGFDGLLIHRKAYWKIARLSGDKNEMSISLDCIVNDKVYQQKSYVFVPSLEGGNFIKQAYEYLKSLPEFADAVDC